jgi:DnaJ like chaperone protein
MGWLEFVVVVGCGLVGFIVVNAIIDGRRAKVWGERNNAGPDQSAHREEATEEGRPKDQNEEVYRSWWEVLNVDRNATVDEIKTAFRNEISRYHPDRVEGLGIELRELADRKSKELNRAYVIAKEQRRFS